jgi:hypothetical protein
MCALVPSGVSRSGDHEAKGMCLSCWWACLVGMGRSTIPLARASTQACRRLDALYRTIFYSKMSNIRHFMYVCLSFKKFLDPLLLVGTMGSLAWAVFRYNFGSGFFINWVRANCKIALPSLSWEVYSTKIPAMKLSWIIDRKDLMRVHSAGRLCSTACAIYRSIVVPFVRTPSVLKYKMF